MRVLRSLTIVAVLMVFLAVASPVSAAPPILATRAATVEGLIVTMKGDINAIGVDASDYRGFVWDVFSFGDPGNLAPAATAYASNWIETGTFGVGEFTHSETGVPPLFVTLLPLTTYYIRACAHNTDGWAYGNEVTVFTREVDKVYIELRPDLSETRIRGNAGIPADALVGIFTGYSLPIWNSNNEELYLIVCVPDRWDEETNILIHIDSCLANVNELGNEYVLEVAWNHATPNDDEEVPLAGDRDTYAYRTVNTNDQYEFYRDWFVLDYDVVPTDTVQADDLIALRVRRVASQAKDLDGNLIIHAVDIMFARGDLLGDPDGWLDDLIDGDILIGGESLILLVLALIPLGLTITMVATRQSMLGMAAALFWAILGGYCYTLYTTPWVDWQYYLMIGSLLGMVPFTALAAFALREVKPGQTYDEDEAVEDRYDSYYGEKKSDDGDDREGGERKPRRSRRPKRKPKGEFD